MLITHDLGRSIAVGLDVGRELLEYDYGSSPKPYFHPLRTLAGHLLTNYQPRDHVWHRGLWFAIKFVNGKNYWEENDTFGAQVTLGPPTVDHLATGATRFTSDIEWRHPEVSPPAIFERRVICLSILDESAYALDFDFTLTAQADILLDRTPYTTWGGYGGLTIRGSRSWINSNIRISDGTVTDRPTGFLGKWAQLHGELDGDRDLIAGVVILDHPDNPRHPTPWYGGTGPGLYLNAALLFHEPMTLEQGQALRLRYRVLVHDGPKDTAEIDLAWREFAS
jgi:hypothetical protein